jgi:hypothetical protein
MFQGLMPKTNMGYAGEKIISGIRVRACTQGASRTFTPYFDGTAQTTTFTLTSSADEPTTEVFNYTAPQTVTDIALYVNDDTEMYEWEPIVLYRKPVGLKAYDTGPVDTGIHDLSWIREIQIKVEAAADLTVTPYFDGTAFTSYSAGVGGYAGKPTVLSVPVGREYKGYQPQIRVTSASEFKPYWVRFFYRPSGNKTQKPYLQVKAS